MFERNRGHCDRCGKPMTVSTCSMFNDEQCCMDCIALEKQHPEYARARDAEHKAVQRGDFNFNYGKPSDL